MKKTKLIILILFLPAFCFSQKDTTIAKELDIDEVVVSAQKVSLLYSKLSRLITVINKDEIKAMPVSNLNELLENYSGIDVRQRGANGIQADISIRGGSFDQNLILLNGVNITDPQTGHHNLNIPLDLSSVERIEILEGPGSRVFGANAFSGAINIITNTSDKNYTKAGFSAGDFGLFTGNITTSYKYNNIKNFISLSKSQSKGYAKNTDFNQYNIFYNINYKSKAGKIDFQTGYTDKEFGANSFYTPAFPDQFEQTKTTFSSLKMETGDKLKIIPAIYYKRHKDRFELFRYEPASWYTGHNYHLTDVYGTKVDSRLNTKIGTTSLGVELRSENIWSNVLGENMIDTINVNGETEGIYTKKYHRTLANYFIEHSFYTERFAFSSGLLASWVSENNFDFNIYPGIDMSVFILHNTKLYATINKSLRLPTFTDLFYSGPSNIGNPNLKPEEAWSYEVGTKTVNKLLNANISFYRRDSKNLIAWVKPIGDEVGKWETQNLTKVKTLGFSASTKISLDKITIKSINLSYNYLTQNSESGKYDTKYSLNYLKNNFIVNVSHNIYKNLQFSWIAKYQDRAGSFQKYDYNLKDYIGQKDFSPYWLMDIKISWNYKIWSIYTETNNLFNKEYEDIGNITMPGRWFKVGFDVHIGYK